MPRRRPVASSGIDPAAIRQAILALEGTTFEDFQFPLPGDLRDLVKASDLVSSTIEDRVPELLNRVREHTWDAGKTLAPYEFRRAAAGFPDCLLVERSPENVVFEIETKSWYVLSRDTITARFKTDPAAITPGTLVIIAGWALDGVVSGSPKISRIHIDDAQVLARARDATWTAQAHRRVLPAQNAPNTPRNLRRTQVTPQQQGSHGTWEAESENFGKIHRIQHQPVKDFIENTLALQAAGRPFKEWRKFIHS